MKKLAAFLASESGVIHTLPLLVIVAAVGIISYLLITSAAPFQGGLFSNLFPRPGSKAAGSLVVTGVAADHSAAKIFYKPVPGAKDYRVYDVSNPNNVKYAGWAHLAAGPNCPVPNSGYCNTHFATQADGVTLAYPLQVVNGQTGGPQGLDIPGIEIDYNVLGDGQPHTLVVEAVDQVGPAPHANLYDGSGLKANIPFVNPLPAGAMLGGNKGPTDDGKISTNGQGPYTNNPQVIAQSQPFIVQANQSYKAIPSKASATQTFFDTFDNAEGTTLKQTLRDDSSVDAFGNQGHMNFSLNAGTPKAWEILVTQANNRDTMPFISSDHFMDVLFDGLTIGVGGVHTTYGALAMSPIQTIDISNGKIAHITEEVDAHQSVNRRWLDINLAPASDPLKRWNEFGGALNNNNQALFMQTKDGTCNLMSFKGPAGNPTVSAPPQTILYCDEFHMYNTKTFSKNGLGLDDKSRYDFFISATHAALFQDGQLLNQADIPAGSFTWANQPIKVYFTHYIYHSDAEFEETVFFTEHGASTLNFCYPLNMNWFNDPVKGRTPSETLCNTTTPPGFGFPYSDERHWDNMGFEVLPASDAPAGNDFSSFASLVALPQTQAPQFVAGATPTPMPSMTDMPMPSQTPSTTLPPSTPNPTSSLIYDNQMGMLVNGWADCSSSNPLEYTHYDMVGMGGSGPHTLHSGTWQNGYLGLCNSNGVNTSGYSAFDFYALADPGNMGTDLNIAFKTMTGQTVTKPIDPYIQGGDTKLVLNKWEHVIVPFSSLALPNPTVTQISFVGTSVTQTIMNMDALKFTAASGNPQPTPTPTPAPTPTPVPVGGSGGPVGQWQQVAVFNNAPNAYGTRDVVNDKNRPSDFYAVAQNGSPYLTKSTNYGQTWTQITPASGASALNGVFGMGIAPSVGTGQATLLIGNGTGFWKSIDGGLNWTNYPIAPAPAGRQDVYGPVVDPYDSNHLLMAAHEQSLLYQSTNGGQTWTLVSLASGMAASGTAFPAFIDTGTASGTRNNWIYTPQDSGGTWRTTNGGSSWTQVNGCIHPHGDSQIYQPDKSGVVYMAGNFCTVMRSTDYGFTWTPMWPQNSSGFSNTMSVVFGTPNNVYAENSGASGCCGPNGPAYATAPQPGTAGLWKAPAVPAGMNGAGSSAIAFDGSHWIIVTANWGSGIWRYVEPAPGGINPTPTPQPIPTACTLTGANWSAATVTPGTPINLNIAGSGSCAGQTVFVQVRRNGTTIDDIPANIQPANPVLSSGNTAITTWIAEFNPLIPLTNPDYYFTANLSGQATIQSNPKLLNVTSASPTPTPTPGIESAFNGPHNLPGTLQLEDYDNGGEGLAYHDTESANNGGAYRPAEGVDIQAATDTGGGFNVGWTLAGEWIKYMVNVTNSGTYNLNFRVASQGAGGTFHLEIDGVNVTSTMTVPDTGGKQTYTTITKPNINLTPGAHTLRMFIESIGAMGGAANFNYLTVTPVSTPTIAPTPTPTLPAQGSVITITAAGQAGVFNGTTVKPTMILQINGVNKQTWTNVGGNGQQNQFLTFTYNSPNKATHDQVRVRFTNDQYNLVTGQDVNLFIQKINIDGTNFPSNAPSVFSNGVWTPQNGCSGGNKQSIKLSCNGFFQY